jgi:hypothetical protein
MTQEALKLALDALERLRPEGFFNEAITAIKEALRENAMREVQRLGQEIEQEPVAIKRMKEWIEYLKRKSDFGQHMKIPSEMSAGTCWELAIELEQFINTTPPQRTEQDHIPDARKMVTEQEPVVGIAAIRTWFKDGRVVTQTLCNSWIDTTPPQRIWVDLTDEEAMNVTRKEGHELLDFIYEYGTGSEGTEERVVAICKAIEAKLKEKNNAA